jgi:hypothetical protein
MKHTFRGRLRLSQLAFPGGLGLGYLTALFDRSHEFKFISTIVASSSLLQLFAIIVIVVAAHWVLRDFSEHFKQFFSVYSLKLDSIKELGEKRMTEIASSKQSIEAALQKLERLPVQQSIQDIHSKIDQLINVLNRSANKPNHELRPGNQKPELPSRPPQGPQPQHRKGKHRKENGKSPAIPKPETQTSQKLSPATESAAAVHPDPQNWASEVI